MTAWNALPRTLVCLSDSRSISTAQQKVDVPPQLIARHHTRRSERNVSIADWMVAPASTSLAFILILTIC